MLTMHNRGGLWASVLAVGFIVVAGTGVEAQGGKAGASVGVASPSIAVVMESRSGHGVARKVRRLMADHLGLAVESLGSHSRRGSRGQDGAGPDAVVAIVTTGSRSLTVHYWDRTGRTDMLTAPRPRATAQIGLVSASLAVAVVRKHVAELRTALMTWRSVPHRAQLSHMYGAASTAVPAEIQRIFGRIAVVRHRTELLTEADF